MISFAVHRVIKRPKALAIIVTSILVATLVTWMLVCGCIDRKTIWEGEGTDYRAVIQSTTGLGDWDTVVKIFNKDGGLSYSELISVNCEQARPDHFVDAFLAHEERAVCIIIELKKKYYLRKIPIPARYPRLVFKESEVVKAVVFNREDASQQAAEIRRLIGLYEERVRIQKEKMFGK